MKKISLAVLTIAMLGFIGFASYKLVPDIFGEKTEIVKNNTAPARSFLLNRGVVIPDNIEKGNWVYNIVVISNREQFKSSPTDLLWVTNRGELYFLFCNR